jgi:hypothetical protein
MSLFTDVRVPDLRLGSRPLGFVGAVGWATLAAKPAGLLLSPEAIALAVDVDGGRMVKQPVENTVARIWSLKTSPHVDEASVACDVEPRFVADGW